MADPLRVRRRRIVLGIATFLLLTPWTVAAQNVDAYNSLVDRYVAGNADAAVAALARWSRADVTKASKEWARLAPAHRLRPATMLHTEAAMAMAIDNVREGAAFHIAVAQGLVQRSFQSMNERE